MSQQKDQILSEDTQRDQGKTAQRMNILAAKLVGETVRTTLGPQGMDKMIVDSTGEVIITNDGATILKEMNIEHPTAKMIVEVAKTQEDEVGDGTTTAVVVAGELLKQAEELLDQNIHPTTIIKGYQLAAKKTQEVLETIGETITIKETKILKQLSMTAMTGKVAEQAKEHLAHIVVQALRRIHSENYTDLDNIKIEQTLGAHIKETELIKGIVLDKEKIHNNMPDKVQSAKIALIDSPLEIQQTDTDAKISISDPSKLQEFLDVEESMLKKMVDRIAQSGANVVLCQKGIDDVVQYLLAQKGIYACRRVKKSDLHKVAKATKGTIITNVKDLSAKELGEAGSVTREKIGDEYMTFLRECRDPKAVTILVHSTSQHIGQEVSRALDDAIGNVASALRAKKIVGGAGAVEIELAKNIYQFADQHSGKEQLAIQSFAKAIEIIPKTLAENAGLDPIDIIADLKSHHDKKRKWAGIDVFSGRALNTIKSGIIEPLPIKTQAMASASDVAVMILRIDDVIVAGAQTPQQGNPHESID